MNGLLKIWFYLFQGLEPGTVVLTEKAVDGEFRPYLSMV
jgi:hypothetical protein